MVANSVFGVIYKITNKFNGKAYIGFTVDFPARKTQHLQVSLGTSKQKSAIHRAIKKYGKENFTWEIILENATLEDEIRLIEEQGTYSKGYNLTLGGEGGSGVIYTEEMRRRRSEVRKGIPKNEEWKKLMRRPKTLEHRQKISQSHMGKKRHPEDMEKVAETKRKDYIVTHPNGQIELVHGLCRFCKQHGLHDSGFGAVLRGKSTHYKGYKIARDNGQSL